MESPVDLYADAIALRDESPARAEALLREAAGLFAGGGDLPGRGECLLELSRLAASQVHTDFREALRLAERAVECLTELETRCGAAHSWAAELALAADDEASARRHLEAAIEKLDGAPRRRALELLGQLAYDEGDLDRAERWWLRAWRVARDPLSIATLRERFAELARARGRWDEARAQLDAAIKQLEGARGAAPRMHAARLRAELADLDAARGDVEEARAGYALAIDCYERMGLDHRAARVRLRLAPILSRVVGE